MHYMFMGVMMKTEYRNARIDNKGYYIVTTVESGIMANICTD